MSLEEEDTEDKDIKKTEERAFNIKIPIFVFIGFLFLFILVWGSLNNFSSPKDSPPSSNLETSLDEEKVPSFFVDILKVFFDQKQSEQNNLEISENENLEEDSNQGEKGEEVAEENKNVEDGKKAEKLAEDDFENALKEGVIIELIMSSLSKEKGTIDIYWGENRSFSRNGIKKIAEPLSLAEGFKIVNNSKETIVLDKIDRENLGDLKNAKIFKDGDNGQFFYAILPQKFILNDETEVVCKDRDLFKEPLDNVCIFEKPIEIASGQEITLMSELFVSPGGWFSYGVYNNENVVPLDEKGKGRFVQTFSPTGKERVLMSNIYMYVERIVENGEIIGIKSVDFNVGGLIFVDLKDEKGVNRIFNLRTKDGQRVLAKIETTEGIRTFEIFFDPTSDKPFPKYEYNDNNIVLQTLLRQNGFLENSEITGYFDERTVSALKAFQKKNNFAETGVFGGMTEVMMPMNFFKGILYHPGFDEPRKIILSLDSPESGHFRYFGEVGEWSVELNDDFSNKSLITKYTITRANGDDTISLNDRYAYYKYRPFSSVEGEGFSDHIGFGATIFNNTLETVLCTIKDKTGKVYKTFTLKPDAYFHQSAFDEAFPGVFDFEKTTEVNVYELQCGNKVMDFEIMGEDTPIPGKG